MTDDPNRHGADAVGDALAADIARIPDPGERQAATRDLAHEMIEAGAEQDLTPRLAAGEIAEEFTDADYDAYESSAAGESSAPGEAPAPAAAPPPRA
jgi:hypothetical protein